MKSRPNLVLGILIVCLLVFGLTLWLRRAGGLSPAAVASPARPQINVPLTRYPTLPASAPAFTVSMHSIGGSGVTGTATFKDVAGSAAVLLHIEGISLSEEDESIMPAELRNGHCADLGALAYSLTVPDAGASETDLPVDLKEFNTQRPMAIVLYRSPQDRTAIACGDLP